MPITKPICGGWSVLTEAEISLLHQFVTRVNARANLDILRDGARHSAHLRAMSLELMEVEKARHAKQ